MLIFMGDFTYGVLLITHVYGIVAAVAAFYTTHTTITLGKDITLAWVPFHVGCLLSCGCQ